MTDKRPGRTLLAHARQPGSPRAAVFLDRDGTLNEDPGYVHRPEDLVFRTGVIEGLQVLAATGLPIVVVTNQGGIGRGRYEEVDTRAFHAAIHAELVLAGVELEGFYWCPHHPLAASPALRTPCGCRKPAPGLLLTAATDHNLELEASFMIGDSWRDVDAGNEAGCTTIRIDHPGPPGTRPYPGEVPVDEPDHVVKSFLEAAQVVRQVLDAREAAA